MPKLVICGQRQRTVWPDYSKVCLGRWISLHYRPAWIVSIVCFTDNGPVTHNFPCSLFLMAFCVVATKKAVCKGAHHHRCRVQILSTTRMASDTNAVADETRGMKFETLLSMHFGEPASVDLLTLLHQHYPEGASLHSLLFCASHFATQPCHPCMIARCQEDLLQHLRRNDGRPVCVAWHATCTGKV